MARYENIYDKIQELLGCNPASVTILEQQIDSDVQSEYYNYSQNLPKKFNQEDILRNRNVLFDEEQTIEDRKDMIVKLATIDHIDAYRTLEKCTGTMTDQLKDWAILALQENRLLLESKFLDQNSILISTGLGGKGLKLRYFTVMISLNHRYSAFEQTVISDETKFAFNKADGELEKIQFDEELCTIIGLIPLHVPVQKFYDDIIAECNLFGNYINPKYIITNVKVISNQEIRKIAMHKKQNPEE